MKACVYRRFLSSKMIISLISLELMSNRKKIMFLHDFQFSKYVFEKHIIYPIGTLRFVYMWFQRKKSGTLSSPWSTDHKIYPLTIVSFLFYCFLKIENFHSIKLWKLTLKSLTCKIWVFLVNTHTTYGGVGGYYSVS